MNTFISVIVPVYNSAPTLSLLADELLILEKKSIKIEIIFVDDCSNDNSWKVIETIKNQYPEKIKAYKLSQNYGQHKAIFLGLSKANGDFAITMDDDLQTHPNEILKLLQKQKETKADLVYGVYETKKHSKFRNFGSLFAGFILSKFGDSYPSGSSFKCIEKSLYNKILNDINEFVYIDEILGKKSKKTVSQVVEHRPSLLSRSRYSNSKLIKTTIKIIYYYTALPLKLITLTGFVSALICFILGLYFIYRKLFFDVELGYTSIIVAIFFSTGIILLCIGIIGEYLRRLFYFLSPREFYKIEDSFE